RAAARQKEITIRAALGATRWRLIRHLLTESVLLSLIGGAFGIALALWGIGLLPSLNSEYIPVGAAISVDGRALGFTFFLSFLTGVVFGLAPAIHSSRLNLSESLKEGGRSSGSGASSNRIRSLLVISEVALALVLLIGAGLFIKSFWLLQK